MEQKQEKHPIIYADNAATTKPLKCAVEAAGRCFTDLWGNPSSVHKAGRDARKVVENAREMIADCIGARKDEIIFASGGTESDNLAILSAADYGEARGKKHIVTTNIEHHAVGHVLEMLEKRRGFEITYVPVDIRGSVYAEDIENAIRPDTCLVTVMTANNEIGTIQPIEDIGVECARHKDLFFHTDAVQAVGHIPVSVKTLRCDYLAASAHKFGGVKGAGFLYVKRGSPLCPQIVGGGQEYNSRAGTENVPAIAAMAQALAYNTEYITDISGNIRAAANIIKYGIIEKVPRAIFNGSDNALPGIINFTFPGVEGNAMLIMLEQAGIYASAGSACNSTELKASHVLKAIGYDDETAKGTIRFSIGEDLAIRDAYYIIDTVADIVERLRKFSPEHTN